MKAKIINQEDFESKNHKSKKIMRAEIINPKKIIKAKSLTGKS